MEFCFHEFSETCDNCMNVIPMQPIIRFSEPLDEEALAEVKEKLSNFRFGNAKPIVIDPVDVIEGMLANVEMMGRRVLFAIESGSRLWGMDSKNSDYDVRFIYARKVSNYLFLYDNNDKTDTMELTDEFHNIDMVGWDISKFLSLAAKSNPTALEWLVSDIIYAGNYNKYLPLLENISPRALFEHYISMAKTNYMRYIHGKDVVPLKKYLYVARGLVNAMYVHKFKKVPPPKIETVLAENVVPGQVTYLIMDLIRIKKSGEELGEEARLKDFDDYLVEGVLNEMGTFRDELPLTHGFDGDMINKMFLESIGYL